MIWKSELLIGKLENVDADTLKLILYSCYDRSFLMNYWCRNLLSTIYGLLLQVLDYMSVLLEIDGKQNK